MAQTFIIVTPDDGPTYVECPHCGAEDSIVEVDQTIRFNTLVFDGDDPMRPRADIGPDGDWDFDHWFCTACMSDELQAPIGFEIRDWL